MAEIKDRIISLRNEKNLTQGQLAKELNLSPSSIGMYEQGRRKPSYELLEKISDYFNVDMDYLVGRSNIKNKYKKGIEYNWESNELSADDKKIQEISNILQKNNNYILSKIKRGNKVDIIENEKIINTVDVEIIFNAYDNKFLKNEFSYQDIVELINLYDIPSELTGIARKQYINFISESAMFFDDDNISDDTKDKIALSMQKIFFLAKEKNKRKK